MPAEASHQTQEDWYVVRTRPKSEHIATANLQRLAKIEQVFCPRIKFEKATQRGKVWFTEALFPGYVFARFDISRDLRKINATAAITEVLHFGDRYPTISDAVMRELRQEFNEENKEIRIVKMAIGEGDEVVVVNGPMTGLKTIVTQLLPRQDRIRILLECLGEYREAEVSLRSVAVPGNVRKEVKL